MIEATAKCTKSDAYSHYREWCQYNGQRYPLTKTMFGRAVRERGFVDARVGERSAKGWAGFRLVVDSCSGRAE